METYTKEALLTLIANELNPKTLKLNSNQKFINSLSPSQIADEYALICKKESKLSFEQRKIIVFKVHRLLQKLKEQGE